MLKIYNPLAFLALLAVPALILICIRTYDRVSTRRKGVLTALRTAVVVAVVIDLVALQVWWTDARQDLCVYYLVDMSTSMQPYRGEVAKTLEASLESRRSSAWAGVILFAAKPEVVAAASRDPDVRRIVETVAGTGDAISRSALAEEQETNLEAAIRLAASSFPTDMAKRICILSDFNETEGHALREAILAGKSGIDIVALDPRVSPRADIAVDRVALAEQVHLHEAFSVHVSVTSSFHAASESFPPAEVRLYRNHVLVASKAAVPSPGTQSIEFRQRLERGGRFVYEARLVTPFPQNPDNDRAYAYLEVKDVPRVLVIADEAAEQRHLREALASARLDVEVRPARGLPQTMLDLEEFDTVVLGNVPATAMTANQMKLIHDYVREFGGSAILTGGPTALSAGGYAGTLIEEVFPAFCSFGEKETPTAALVVVMDTSTSMRIHPEDFKGEKPTFVRQILGHTAEVLSDRDRIGALGFASELKNPQWYVPFQQVVDRPKIRQTALPFDDRSNLYRPLTAAYERLMKVNATNKGILIVTDGYVEPGYDYAQLAMQMASGEVSISCVAVGRDANHPLLREIARWGNGRYYAAEDLAEATQLLEREFEEFARSVIVERPVQVLALAKSDVFTGIDLDLSPALFGYVRVKPKLSAETLLVTDLAKEPILVTWRYGAGRCTLFTTDVLGKWSQLWVSDWSDQFGQFWQNLVTWDLHALPGISYVPRAQARGWELWLSADALDPKNKFVNDQPPKSGLYPLGEKGQVFSEESRIEIRMDQTGPGRYQARHKVDRSGVYLFRVSGGDGSGVSTTGAVVSVNRELASLLPNIPLRQELCRAAQGQVLDRPESVFDSESSAQKRPHDPGAALALIACVLFTLDVLTRRWPAVTEFLRRKASS